MIDLIRPVCIIMIGIVIITIRIVVQETEINILIDNAVDGT